MIKKILTFLILGLIVMVLPKTVLGFGITPAEIYVQNLTPGSHYERLVYVTRPANEVNETLKVKLEPDLGDALSWFKFEPGTEFDFPSGKNVTTFKVIIDVPQNAQLKSYIGQITAKGLPDKTAAVGVTMVKGAVLGVNIATSNASSADLKVLSVSAPDVNAGDPVRLLLNIQNSGNFAAAPDKVNLEVMDLFENPKESLSDSTLEKIEPFATKEIKAEFNSNLEKGQYRIDASVIFKGKEIYREKMVLTVNAKPAKAEPAVQQPVTSVSVRQGSKLGLILAILGLLLLILILLLYLRKSRKSDPEFEKRLARIVQENTMIMWILIIVSSFLVLSGLYLNYIMNVAVDNNPVMTETVSGRKNVGPTVSPTVAPTTKPSKKSTNVQGVSTEAEEVVAPFVVKNETKSGLYPVYSSPSFDAKVIYGASSDETFSVIKQVGDWYSVILPDKTLGWLHKSSIKSSQ